MPLNPVLVELNTATPSSVAVIRTGKAKWCFGKLTFGASDTYPLATGIDVSQAIRRMFGVQQIIAIFFLGTSSDADAAATYSHVRARFIFTPFIKSGDTESALIRLYAVGRIIGPAVEASNVELANGDSINALSFPFMAICTGEGAAFDSQMGPN